MSENNDLFTRDNDFSKLVKKARRKSLIKNIVISLVVSLLLFAGLFWLGTFLMYKKMDKEISYDYAIQSIQGANVQNMGSLYNYTPFSASVTTETKKFISGVPVPWENYEKVFSIFGSSRNIQSNFVTGTGSIEDERIPVYFQGERVIEFYTPNGNYKFLPDDRSLLNKINENKVVEMAFSFDTAYSIEEVESRFSNQLNWYWVDTGFTEVQTEELEPIFGNNAHGFLTNQDSVEAANRFIQQIKWLQEEQGDFREEANRFYETMTKNGQTDLEPENLEIIGVVVTGTPEELKRFNDVQMIRAAVLGVTADEY
ncbi:anti sigma factor C-terminal domain-containing protein [Planomicrobium okeanokoites]|uniref:anti sigma factor C-terminal domain-containing protein n=1 Tax=Planomicrobium okeanokoites TaxID=244 RepID=UPI000A015D39|nr:anti sigma factor C-terminal domain-containing protein [Planomicrobium okeanokoites]